MNRYYNANPSKDLSYSSLAIDEQNRSQHAHKIADSARFRNMPVNGNVASVTPEAAVEDLRQSLPRHLQVDTNTRTVFQDSFYQPKDGIAEFVGDSHHGLSAPRAQPHVAMCDLATNDPRIRRMKPAYDAPLAPGYYETDPLGDRGTGTLTMAAGEVHHAVQLGRDPNRPSAVFQSAPRGRTARDISDEAAAPLISSRMTEPDYAHWTSKGSWAPRGDRRIEAERWGRNAREPKPPAAEQSQSVYTPHVTSDGHPNSSEAYTAARYSPAYKAAFASGLPRTVALPGGNRPDTRLQIKTYDDVCGSGPDVGPGSYNPEPARMRSSNAAYDNSSPYYTLGSGSPAHTSRTGASGSNLPSPHPSPHGHGGLSGQGSAGGPLSLLPPQLQHQLIATGSFGSLASPSSPTGPYSPTRGAGAAHPLSLTSGSGGGGNSFGRYSEPSSPSALRAAAVRAERIAAAALVASTSGRERSPSRAPPALSPLGQQQQQQMGYEQSYDQSYGSHADVGGGGGHLPYMGRAQSAPVTVRTGTSASAAMRAAQAKQFNKLVFMQRHTPCASLLRSHLVVAADLRKERQRLRNG